jgi:hypothetical protein
MSGMESEGSWQAHVPQSHERYIEVELRRAQKIDWKRGRRAGYITDDEAPILRDARWKNF